MQQTKKQNKQTKRFVVNATNALARSQNFHAVFNFFQVQGE
jgi:hypothetical protein